jgi:23S rRNA G2445 N2-methylase RlmL
VTLDRRLADPGFVPRPDDVEPLLRELGADDRKHVLRVERALARLGSALAPRVLARLDAARPPLRARLVRLLGRIDDASVEPRLVALLRDADRPTRRQAVVALGKLGGEGARAALLEAWHASERDPAQLRALVEALGRTGDAAVLDLLAGVRAGDDPELARVLAAARTGIERRRVRAVEGGIDGSATLEGAVVRLHVREGIEAILRQELPAATAEAPGRLRLELAGPLAGLFASRTLLRFGFPLRTARGRSIEEVVCAALASEEAAQIVSAFTRGAARWRIEWAAGPRRRAMTRRVAEAVQRVRPTMINDPVGAWWEAVVEEEGRDVSVELWPRGLHDPRFDYRKRSLPASSHPTIAAALVRVAGPRDDDVVWDPFVGAGTELVERARLGPYRRLFGTDRDAGAVDAARENLAAAAIDASITRADVASWRPPEPVTLLLTNPPLGRRVDADLDRLYATTFERAAAAVAPGGRFVWISPRAGRTVALAREAGFVVERRLRVDMGGFWAELQRFRRSSQ